MAALLERVRRLHNVAEGTDARANRHASPLTLSIRLRRPTSIVEGLRGGSERKLRKRRDALLIASFQ